MQRKILLINICNVAGGVENTFCTLLKHLHNSSDFHVTAVLTPTTDNASYIAACHNTGAECREEPALTKLFYGPQSFPPSPETGPATPEKTLAPPRPLLKSRLIKFVKHVIPPALDRAIWQYRLSQRAEPLFRKIYAKTKPDLIHAMAGSYMWLAPAIRARTPDRKIPILFHINTEPVLGDLSRFTLQQWLKADALIYVSNQIKAAWEAKYPALASLPAHVIHNGIDLVPFPYIDRSQRSYSANNPFRIGLCGRLTTAKGFDIAIQAFHHIHQKFPNTRLEIVGEGTERENLERLVRELGLTGHVIFHGFQKNVAPFFASFDLFLQPSRAEAFGITLIEAMASGLPIIASRVGGIPEVVVDMKTGILIEPESPDLLAQETIKLIHNAAQRNVLGSAGKTLSHDKFSKEEMCLNTVKRYHALIS